MSLFVYSNVKLFIILFYHLIEQYRIIRIWVENSSRIKYKILDITLFTPKYSTQAQNLLLWSMSVNEPLSSI